MPLNVTRMKGTLCMLEGKYQALVAYHDNGIYENSFIKCKKKNSHHE